jgi:hypothetical protein
MKTILQLTNNQQILKYQLVVSLFLQAMRNGEFKNEELVLSIGECYGAKPGST